MGWGERVGWGGEDEILVLLWNLQVGMGGEAVGCGGGRGTRGRGGDVGGWMDG